MIHFVDLTGSDKWALICDSILEKQLSDNVEMLSSFPNTGQKVLEIGCSTGQITEYLSSEGKEVWALDTSSSMLRRAKSRVGNDGNVKFRQLKQPYDFSDFDFRFDQVLILNSWFTSILGESEQKHFLSKIHDILSLSGQLVISMDMMKPDNLYRDPSVNYHLIDALNSDDEGRISVSEQGTYEEFSQHWDVVISADLIKENGVVTESFQKTIFSRYTHIFEMIYLLKICGFDIEGVYGDLYGHSLTDAVTKIIWVANRNS